MCSNLSCKKIITKKMYYCLKDILIPKCKTCVETNFNIDIITHILCYVIL